MSNRLNDAPILDQLDGQYQKFLLMILRKYVPDGAVISFRDIEALAIDQAAGNGWVLFSHGHNDSIEFKAIRESDAARLAMHEDATNRGRA